jgi:peptidyl-prolyl cis-trans isomerase SurA
MRLLTLCAIAFLTATPALSQDPVPNRAGEVLIDRVAAVVGDTVLLLSDVHADVQQVLATGAPPPATAEDMDALMQNILQSRVADLILLQAAREMGLSVSDEDMDRAVEGQIAEVRQRFPNEAALTAALQASGMSMERYRGMLAQQFRNSSMVQEYIRMQMRLVSRPTVTDAELRELFELQRHQMPALPPTVSLQQVIVETRASAAAREAARERAESVLQELRGGGDFAVLARRFSDDVGTREHGGQLGWFRRGRMVKPFEDAVFSMRAGQVSPLVETDFGFHIIRLEKTRGPERQARHILIRPEITDADGELARIRADSVAEAVRGGAPIRELARRYDTPPDAAVVERVPIDRLPEEYQSRVSDARPGEVLAPIAVSSGTGTAFAVVRVSDRREGGLPSFQDVEEVLRARLQEQKMVEEIVERARERMHIRVLL